MARAPTPQAWLHERSGWQRTTVRVRGRDIPLTWRVEGPYVRRGAPRVPLFLLVVKGIQHTRRGHARRRKPAYFLVNAVEHGGAWSLPRPAEELLAWAWQRWEIEVTHRELKSTWGLGAMQCWSVPATVRAVQLQAWSYGLCVLAGYRAWGLGGHPRALRPAGLWWRGAPRWSLATLWRGYRQELRSLPHSPGSRGTWAETEVWLAHLDALLLPAPAA